MPLSRLLFYRSPTPPPIPWRRLPLLARRLLILADGVTLSDLARILDTLVADLSLPLRVLLDSGLLVAVAPCEAPPCSQYPFYACLRPLPFWLDFLLFGGTNYGNRYAIFYRFYACAWAGYQRPLRARVTRRLSAVSGKVSVA